MKGLSLRSLRLDLHKTESDSEDPAGTITTWEEKLAPWASWISEWYDVPFNFPAKYYDLPLKAFSGFSFDELCKLYYSSKVMMHTTVDDFFRTHAQHEVVRKIMNSMWRWGLSKGTWNEIVDAYNNIRAFTFIDNPDFELRLDYSTYFNERGHAKYSRVYLDGVFAFLVYYKKRHVLTIGFTILNKKRILVQQVQATQRSGNRCFFKLPNNRVEFVLDLFSKNFPGYKLFVVDGQSLASRILEDYRHGLKRVQESKQRWSDPLSQEYLKKLEEDCREFERRITHLESDSSRLAATYRDVGRHRLGSKSLKFLNLPHFPVSVRLKDQPLAA